MFSLNRSQIGCLLELVIASCTWDFMIRSKNTSTPSSPRYYHRLLDGLMCARQASKHINIYIKILWDTILISSNHGTYKFSNHSCLQFINPTALCVSSSNTYRLNDCLALYAVSAVYQSYICLCTDRAQ